MLSSCAVTLLVLALAPAVLLAGELVNRHYRGNLLAPRERIPVRRGKRVVLRDAGPGRAEYAMFTRDHRVARRILTNPLWIALTAPARWFLDRIRPRRPPGAGVREPRRPLPDLPAGAMALPEPGPFD